VVNPYLAKTYPGGRCGTKLDVYNLAHGSQKHGVARLDIPMDVADNRLAEVAKQNACISEELVDSVKTVAICWGRANCLSEDPLKLVIKKLGETQEDHRDTIRGLNQLVKLGAKTLKKLVEILGESLEKAPRVEKTGERSFAAVAEGVKDLASREMLESINKGKTKGGNNYSNVIYAIVSCISNLSQVSGIPDNRTLFQCTGGMRLSDCFYVEDETGVRGGVELAHLSTTTACAVAMHYIVGLDLPTVCCIQVSAVSKGASLSNILQFPGEDEVLMPPGSFLEVVGRPRVVQLENCKSILEIPMQISCPKTATIEQTRASRKTSLLSMVDHLLLEIHRESGTWRRCRERTAWPNGPRAIGIAILQYVS
jgi:hypothetical protein